MVAGRAWTIVDDAPCSNIIDTGWESARVRVLVLGTNGLTGLAVAAEFAVAGWDVAQVQEWFVRVRSRSRNRRRRIRHKRRSRCRCHREQFRRLGR